MKKILLFLVATVALFSCGGSKKEESKNSVSDITDKNYALASLFKTENVLPYAVDTNLLYIDNANCDSLGTNDVRQLDTNWFRLDKTVTENYDLREFYKIDSIKASGTYASWCDSLEPGNTKCSNAYAICRIKADSITDIFVWELLTSSYEACPYSTTKTIYFSVLRDGIITQSFTLGEYISAGDPPVSMRRTHCGKINKDLTFEWTIHEEDDEDMDQPEINVTRERYEFAMKDGKIRKLSVTKQGPAKVKRKK